MQNAGLHGLGAFGLTLEEDGGLVSQARMTVGYGRRGVESLALGLPIAQTLNYLDRVDFLAAPAASFALASAYEELLHIEVPERAARIRMVLLELNRIFSHLHFYAKLARAAGQTSTMNHCLREQERFSDILEMYCGSRLGFGSICIGGVIADATDGWFFKIEKAVANLRDFLPDLESSLLAHPFFAERARGLAVITSAEAEARNITGPNARAAGCQNADLRLRTPYGAYQKTPVPSLAHSYTEGDVLDRARLRMEEILQSARLIAEGFRSMPAGNFRIRVGMDVRPSPGKACCGVEGPRGAIFALVEADGGAQPADVSYFGPSAMLVQALPGLLRGLQVEDAFLVLHSLDISFSEVDK